MALLEEGKGSSSKFFFEEVSLLGGKAANDSNPPGSERPHQRQQVCYGCVTRPVHLVHGACSTIKTDTMKWTRLVLRTTGGYADIIKSSILGWGRAGQFTKLLGADLKSFTFFPPRSMEDLCWLRKRISLKRQELSASDQEELDQLQKRSMAANVIRQNVGEDGWGLSFWESWIQRVEIWDFESTNNRCKKIERNKIPCWYNHDTTCAYVWYKLWTLSKPLVFVSGMNSLFRALWGRPWWLHSTAPGEQKDRVRQARWGDLDRVVDGGSGKTLQDSLGVKKKGP